MSSTDLQSHATQKNFFVSELRCEGFREVLHIVQDIREGVLSSGVPLLQDLNHHDRRNCQKLSQTVMAAAFSCERGAKQVARPSRQFEVGALHVWPLPSLSSTTAWPIGPKLMGASQLTIRPEVITSICFILRI